ncbi:MAG: hypothetical protein HOE11_03860 [Candidatus Diapherotrites archaeon]|jgi:hypothetical protein|nr:hypothetical protein [Candidatus Diapherotrites archaeon]MBT4597234.1 hypothetical protein [Candidatus Diapherotrites archaeon]
MSKRLTPEESALKSRVEKRRQQIFTELNKGIEIEPQKPNESEERFEIRMEAEYSNAVAVNSRVALFRVVEEFPEAQELFAREFKQAHAAHEKLAQKVRTLKSKNNPGGETWVPGQSRRRRRR